MIVVAARWYLRYGLSYRDVEELLTERGVEVEHVTIYRRVQRFTRCWPRQPGPAATPWACADASTRPYVKVAGRWRYVYRAIDQSAQVIDVFVSHGGIPGRRAGSSTGPSPPRG